MDVFISWSGETSMRVAEALREWLPNVIQAINPYFTPKDIDKGQRWSQDIAGKLNDSQFGIILVTRDNINAPWLLFEAGALSKNIGTSSVCPILLDLKPTDLSGPLAQFQSTIFGKDEIKKLLGSLNSALPEKPLPEKTLDNVFTKWWPDLDKKISACLIDDGSEKEELRSDRELIEEILRLARSSSYTSFDSGNYIHDKLNYKPVSYNEISRAITIWLRKDSPYEIFLDQINSGAELMDFVLQINSKGITKPEHIKAFLDCIEQLSDRYFQKNAQGVFCPGGKNLFVEWP